jgi:hypothetical protein
MVESMFSGEPAHRDTFTVGGVTGAIAAWFGLVPEVREAGYGAVWGEEFERQDPAVLSRLAGFPAILVRVEPAGLGYRNWLGWVQLVRESALDGAESKVEVDPIWYLEDKDIPFAAMGYCPTFFDSPSRTERAPIRWEADLYLCTVPTVTDPELKSDIVIHPLCGVRWGFHISDGGANPEPSNPRRSPSEAWPAHSAILSTRFPSWHFQP